MKDNARMSDEQVDCVVVGAGVVGLAVARALAQAGREVIILEAENAFGTATSARNSEVIHAGIYYPTGSVQCVAVRARQGACSTTSAPRTRWRTGAAAS